MRRERRSATRPIPLVLASALAFCSVHARARAEAPGAGTVDFRRDVLPILSDNCFQCHGPDPAARKAKLRLDTEDGALRAEEPVIIPGRSGESELFARLISGDELEVMPPPKSNRKLTPGQIDKVRRWIDEGARWSNLWSLTPPRRPSLPEAEGGKAWVRNPIDRFVLDRLGREGLAPSQEARKEALIRRAAFDLTGLPPDPEEVDAFLADAAPDAFDRLVDRLLASPRYGERMAVDWLDLARFADTHGFQMDRERPMWAWRDWVIRSFNRNQRFDEFVTWQVAGDLLPNPTREQRLATAFNRLHMQNEEGGVVEEEFRVSYVVDRVDTFGTAFLGLTLECSRCHDHKFDPITQRDFYSLFSFFQNIDESGQTSYFTTSMPVPTVLLSDDATDARLEDLDRRILAKERQLKDVVVDRGEFERWLVHRPEEPTVPGQVASFAFDTLDDKSARPHEGPELVEGKSGKAVLLDGEDGFTFPKVGHFTRVDPFSFALWVRAPEHTPRAVVLHHSKAPIDAGSRGYEILLEGGRVAVGLHHMWPGNSLKVSTAGPIPVDAWTHLTVTYDGSSRASGLAIFVDGKRAPLEVIRDGLVKDITYGGGEPDLALGHRFRDNGFKGGRVDDLRVFDRALTALEAAHLAGLPDLREAWDAPDRRLFDYYLANASPVAGRLAGELHALRLERSRLVDPIPEAMAMKELPRPKPAFILKRGSYDSPGEPVTAATPGALPPFPADQPRNRLGLARWLLAPDHPLMARVTVNRLWQMMFGQGLVETSDNFGNQGTPPTHPELLDWLALEFVDSGWDVKHLLKLIATSATYRQSSRASPALLGRDPSNQLLARGPSRRLTAEMLRDQALATSGLLVERLGGPSVRPYQPEGLWSVAMGSPRYDQSKGPDLYRRSLYTYWKRTVPHPALVVFDAADRSNCSVRRQSTSTPLQALALLNDPQVVEAARKLGEHALGRGGRDDADRSAWLFRRITGRRPGPREAAVLTRLLAEQRAIFSADREAAGKLIAVGESRSDPAFDPVELASATVLAQAILNHDEAVMRR